MQTVLVNATALVSGGALSILKQFLCNIDNNSYHVFVSEGVELDCLNQNNPNKKIWYIPRQSALVRIYWDFYGLKKFANQHDLKYQVLISLQNTSVASEAEKQIVYIHQGIPFHERSWSFFKKNERRYAFYKYIYPWFIFANKSKDTEFVVQTEWMQESLIKKFRIPKEKVHNIKPSFIKWDLTSASDKISTAPLFNIFYPATGEIFKNHRLIFLALNYIYEKGVPIDFVRVHFTFNQSQYSHIVSLLDEYPHLKKCIVFTGKLTYRQVIELYELSDLILFPSQIESFGLPLIESAYAGRKIIALSTPFAYELLSDYEGCGFVKDNVEEWGQALADAISNPRQNFHSFNPIFKNGWAEFFQLLNKEN